MPPTETPRTSSAPLAPSPPDSRARHGAAWRSVAILLVALSGAAVLGYYGQRRYPIGQWLFWRYAGYWLACGVWALASLAGGHALLRRLLPRALPFREHLALSFATGVFLNYLLMSVAGLLHLLRAPLFFALPVLMLAAGGASLARTSRRFLRGALAQRQRRGGGSPWSYLLFTFGLLGFLMVYFVILSPENVQFDSRWKHFALAEEYVVTGGVRRFAEGWTVETNPHLATYVYSWGFLLPFGKFFDRVELAAHLEFAIFVATTLMLPTLVRRLVPGASGRYAWTARFLFPGIFLYDSSLSGGADHIAALFAVPLFLVVLRARRELEPKLCVLAAVMLAGGAMSKLTALLMLTPVVAGALGLRAVIIALRGGRPGAPPRRRAWIGPLAAVGVGLAVTSTFWLKNWIWYGDPIYPSLHKYLHLRPWVAGSADLFEWGYKDFQFWRPTHDLSGVWQTIKALFTFSFIPNDYPRYHGISPVFGSLFTVLVFTLPFLRRTKRIWGLVAATHVAILIWYWIHHQDRYLQTLMPWIAGATAATLVLAWRSGWPARVGLGAVVTTQLVVAGDTYFIPTHSMVGSPLKASIDLLSAGFRKQGDKRFRVYSQWTELGRRLPSGSRVLLHDNHTHLGLGAETVNDWGGWQFGIRYDAHGSPGQVYELFRGMGVTHIVYESNRRSKGWDSLAGDIVFYDFVLHHAEGSWSSRGLTLVPMPAQRPRDQHIGPILYLGCGKTYGSGLYDLSDLAVPVFGPRSRVYPRPRTAESPAHPVADLAATARVLVLDQRCRKPVEGFALGVRRKVLRPTDGSKELTVWFRHDASRG